MPNSISVLGILSHIMKVCENLKSAIQNWSVVIPNALIGDPSTALRCIDVDCVAVSKWWSMFSYVEYLTREMEMTASESMRDL